MSYWTITFESPWIADNAARIMRAYYFDPDITGPDPKLPTLKYFDSMCESREQVEKLLGFFFAREEKTLLGDSELWSWPNLNHSSLRL